MSLGPRVGIINLQSVRTRPETLFTFLHFVDTFEPAFKQRRKNTPGVFPHSVRGAAQNRFLVSLVMLRMALPAAFGIPLHQRCSTSPASHALKAKRSAHFRLRPSVRGSWKNRKKRKRAGQALTGLPFVAPDLLWSPSSQQSQPLPSVDGLRDLGSP